MKIKGQHGEFGYENQQPIPKRQIEIEEGERISIRVTYKRANPVKDDEVISFFMPGVLTLEWDKGAEIED